MTARARPERAVAGTMTHDGRPMKYAHAQRAAYVLDRCRCDSCRAATTAAQREMRNQIAPAYVAADPARQHIRFLSEHGVGLKRIAKVSGVSQGALWKLVYGKAGHEPSKRVRKDTLDRILAVMPSDAAAGTRADAKATWALIDEMVSAGVPKARIGAHPGWSRSWPRKRVAAAVAAACTDPDIAADLDRWRALSLELSRLADRHGWKDPARAAEIEHERYDLRRDTEHRYGHAAALDLLALASASAATVDGQLSLFEAAS